MKTLIYPTLLSIFLASGLWWPTDVRAQAPPRRKTAPPAGSVAGKKRRADKLFAEARSLVEGVWEGGKKAALPKLETACPLYAEVGDANNEGNCYTWLAELYAGFENVPKRLEYDQRALLARRRAGDWYGQQLVIRDMIFIHQKRGEHQKVIELQKECLRLSRENGDKKGEADELYGLGITYRDLGDDRLALDHFEQALAVRRASGLLNKDLDALFLVDIGSVHAKRGDSRKALDAYNEALQLYIATGNKKDEADVRNKIEQEERKAAKP
jgi:tetratricopeptide (TPR) repeat protein